MEKPAPPLGGCRHTHNGERLGSSSKGERLSLAYRLIVGSLQDAVKFTLEAFTPWSIPLVEPLDGVVRFPSGNRESRINYWSAGLDSLTLQTLENLFGAILVNRNRTLTSIGIWLRICLLYTSPSPRDGLLSRMPSSA